MGEGILGTIVTWSSFVVLENISKHIVELIKTIYYGFTSAFLVLNLHLFTFQWLQPYHKITCGCKEAEKEEKNSFSSL